MDRANNFSREKKGSKQIFATSFNSQIERRCLDFQTEFGYE